MVVDLRAVPDLRECLQVPGNTNIERGQEAKQKSNLKQKHISS